MKEIQEIKENSISYLDDNSNFINEPIIVSKINMT